MKDLTRRELIAGAALLGAARTARGWEAALPVTVLDHVNIRVPDVRRSGEFYGKLFGTEVGRADNAFASAGTRRGVLWFVRLGACTLAISPCDPGEKPGIDHYCFGVDGFNKDTMHDRLSGLNLIVDKTDPPGNNLWTKDPAGYLIQFSRAANPARGPGSGVGGKPVEPPGGGQWNPTFQVTRITQLTLAPAKLEPSAEYYRKLLGPETEKPRKGTFQVGPAELVLGPASGGEHFRVGSSGFDPAAAVSKLKTLGIAARVGRDKNSVAFRDPDGVPVEIGA